MSSVVVRHGRLSGALSVYTCAGVPPNIATRRFGQNSGILKITFCYAEKHEFYRFPGNVLADRRARRSFLRSSDSSLLPRRTGRSVCRPSDRSVVVVVDVAVKPPQVLFVQNTFHTSGGTGCGLRTRMKEITIIIMIIIIIIIYNAITI
jgi:hypothetical protein